MMNFISNAAYPKHEHKKIQARQVERKAGREAGWQPLWFCLPEISKPRCISPDQRRNLFGSGPTCNSPPLSPVGSSGQQFNAESPNRLSGATCPQISASCPHHRLLALPGGGYPVCPCRLDVQTSPLECCRRWEAQGVVLKMPIRIQSHRSSAKDTKNIRLERRLQAGSLPLYLVRPTTETPRTRFDLLFTKRSAVR